VPKGGEMKLEISAYTHVGRVRDENQDFHGFGIDEELFIVADGMGGHSFGREAAISAVAAAVCKGGSLEEKCIAANEVVKNLSNSCVVRFGKNSPGTTLLLARKVDDKFELASVGDSYIMKLSNKVEIINDRHEDQYGYLTAYIGMQEPIKVWKGCVDLKVGDRYMLVTDGIDALTDKKKLLDCINAEQVIDEVLKTSAYDNITCIYIDVK